MAILPISGLVGLISLTLGLVWKSGLWSFSVTKAFLGAVLKTLSSNSSSLTVLPCSQFMWVGGVGGVGGPTNSLVYPNSG